MQLGRIPPPRRPADHLPDLALAVLASPAGGVSHVPDQAMAQHGDLLGVLVAWRRAIARPCPPAAPKVTGGHLSGKGRDLP
jgi:hypothetical protein